MQIMRKAADWFFGLHQRQSIRRTIERIEDENEVTSKKISGLYKILDGKESLFLNVCDADDSEERDCPLDIES